MSILNSVIDHHIKRFNRPPKFAASAPGRVNLIGEHTDYNDGFVLPIAINRETIVAASKSESDISTLLAVDLKQEMQIDWTTSLEPVPRQIPGAFANYLLGVVDQFKKLGHDIPNLNITVSSNIPIGAGLSSSASVEVATATMLEVMFDIKLEPLDKILLCQRAEHEFPGTPCGVMDMYISTCAVEDHALLIDCRSNHAEPVPLPSSSEMAILIVDTGVKHDLSTSEYAERRDTCKAASNKMQIASLRDATNQLIESTNLTETETHRASHVVMENVRTLLAVTALQQNRVDEFCKQMFESHKSLRNLYAVSCPELDCVVDTASDIASQMRDDQIGARMTGGGFGGCAIIYCRTGAISQISQIIENTFETVFSRKPTILQTHACSGARFLELIK